MSQLRARRCCVGRCRRLNGGSCRGGARAPTTCGQGKQDGQENKRSHATEPPPFGHVCKAGRSLPLLAALKGSALLPWGARPPAFKVQSCRLVRLLRPLRLAGRKSGTGSPARVSTQNTVQPDLVVLLIPNLGWRGIGSGAGGVPPN